jgi:hypothetical protein
MVDVILILMCPSCVNHVDFVSTQVQQNPLHQCRNEFCDKQIVSVVETER